MVLFICILFLSSLFLSTSSYIYKFLEIININNSDKKEFKFISLSLSLGFIFTFVSISVLNIILHIIGITFSTYYLLIPFTFIFYKKNSLNIKNFLVLIHKNINQIPFKILKNKDPILIILFIIISTQIFCLFIRFLLPLTHGDAIGQYFYDSLQISRLDSISIAEYYKIGGYFRSDSLASFFDAFILQISDNWFLVRSIRIISLLLVIFNSIEIASNIGNISFKKSILLISVIVTLPDVWDLALSVKQDGYVFLFELTCFYLIVISLYLKKNSLKILFSIISILIAFTSIGIRLSSITLFITSIILLIYYLFNKSLNFNDKEIKQFIFSRFFLKASFITAITFSTLTFAFFNNIYFSNPFYWLSPPDVLNFLFPNESHLLNYENIKETLSLRNVPILLKPVTTFLYASLGLEPIRYGLNKFKENYDLFLTLSNYLNFIGPQGMMVSILSFSPFSILPYFGFMKLRQDNKKVILILISIWILLWSISVPYTRVAMASSIFLVVFAFSEPYSFKDIFPINNIFRLFKISIISYGLISIILFTTWSVSYLYDLPLKSLFSKAYSRTELTRSYITLQDKIFGIKSVIPNQQFEKDWKKIEEENLESQLLLLRTPKIYAYFMNRGLIVSKSNKKISSNKKIKCFEIDEKHLIKNSTC